ncbi:hypothetical protein QTP88_010284 [Uroleucon formosanum]
MSRHRVTSNRLHAECASYVAGGRAGKKKKKELKKKNDGVPWACVYLVGVKTVGVCVSRVGGEEDMKMYTVTVSLSFQSHPKSQTNAVQWYTEPGESRGERINVAVAATIVVVIGKRSVGLVE